MTIMLEIAKARPLKSKRAILKPTSGSAFGKEIVSRIRLFLINKRRLL